MKFKPQNGQMLIEAMVAISILIVGILGMVNLLNQTLGLNVIVTSQYIGSNLAMEGVEVVKNLIDSNFKREKPWNEGLGPGDYEVEYNTNSTPLIYYSGKKLWFNPGTGLYSYFSVGKETDFTRKVQISYPGGNDEIKVNSIVSWQIKGGTRDINVEDHFFNWRQ